MMWYWISVMLFLCTLHVACSAEPELNKGVAIDKVSIAHVKSLYNGVPLIITDEIAVEGVLISSDSDGNFKKSLVIQDQTSGLEIRVDIVNSFVWYYVGMHYIVYCKGLAISDYGGQLRMGYRSQGDNYGLVPIPESKISSHIKMTDKEEVAVLPINIDISTLSSRLVDQWVIVTKVQFIEEEIGLKWADNNLRTTRHLINQMGDTLAVNTSADAVYANIPLPSGSGSIEGILGNVNNQFLLSPTLYYYILMNKPRF